MAQDCEFCENEILVDIAALKLEIIVLPLEKAFFFAYANNEAADQTWHTYCLHMEQGTLLD